MATTLKYTLGTLAFAGLMGISAIASAAPPGMEAEARQHYSRGVELYNDGIYGAALAELERAQALAPHYGILHSIGLVKVQLADFVGALTAFEEYLAAGGDEVPAQRKQEVKEKVASLQERIGTVDVTTVDSGLEIAVDDAVVGTSPLGKTIRINPGKHDLAARRPGEKGDVKKLSIAGGDKLKIQFDAIAAPKPVGPTIAPEKPQPRAKSESPMPTWVLGTWIATGACAIGATTTGIIGLGKSSDLEKQRNDQPSSAAALDDAASEVKTFGIVTDVLIGSAVVLGAVSVIFTLRGMSEPAAPTHTTSTKPRFGFGPTGIAGTF